jgi:uncharacterized protein
MIHPDSELRFISNEIGYGVVATKLIPAGTITWVLDKLDREFSPVDFQNFEPIYQSILDTYTYRNSNGNFVLCWDNARYVNHSFNSNCLTTAYDFEIAIRDILPGEQITDDYEYLNVPFPFRGIDEGTRRKIVYPDDLKKYFKYWDKRISKVFGKITEIDQPLRQLISDELWDRIHLIVEGKEQIDSILNNYFDENNHISKE